MSERDFPCEMYYSEFKAACRGCMWQGWFWGILCGIGITMAVYNLIDYLH